MAIAFDTNTNNSSTTATSLTYAHTCTGSDRMLFVGLSSGSGDLVTGVTYAGVSMSQVGKIKQGNATGFTYLYVLFAPATGANNIVASASSSTAFNSMSSSYTGVNQSNTMNASNTSSIATNTLNFSTSATSTVNNCWAICYCINDTNVFASNSDTRRGTNVGGNIFDTNSSFTAGSRTMTQTVTGSGNGSVVMAIFSESIVASGNSNFLGFL